MLLIVVLVVNCEFMSFFVLELKLKYYLFLVFVKLLLTNVSKEITNVKFTGQKLENSKMTLEFVKFTKLHELENFEFHFRVTGFIFKFSSFEFQTSQTSRTRKLINCYKSIK